MGVIVFIAFDTAIDIEVDRYQHAERLILIFDFNLLGLTLMVEQFHPFSDQSYRAFIQPSVESDAAVFVDLVDSGREHLTVAVVVGSREDSVLVEEVAVAVEAADLAAVDFAAFDLAYCRRLALFHPTSLGCTASRSQHTYPCPTLAVV